MAAAPPQPRVATAADARDVGHLLHDFNTEFDVPSPGGDVLTERLERLLAGPSVFAIIAEDPPVAVALLTVRPNVWYDGYVAILDELYVVPDRRGEGIGAAMLELVRDHASARGVDAIEISVDEGDIDAQRFYERHGYSSADPETGERAYFFVQELVEEQPFEP